MNRALVISPHLDDAVLGAGTFMAGRPDCVVATIFAGTPDDLTQLTEYDAVCGFKTSEDAVLGRRKEDCDALELVKATAVHCGFTDSQYGTETPPEDIAGVIVDLALEYKAEFVLGPMGLLHPDHVRVREGLLLASADPELTVPVWLYEELPHRVQRPEAVHSTVRSLTARGYALQREFLGDGPVKTKEKAVRCYKSQLGLHEFRNLHEVLVGERFWRVQR